MSGWPDSSNFYSSVSNATSPKQVARLFATVGWEVIEPDDWDHLEVRCPWAELVVEDTKRVILLHGVVIDVEANAERVLEILDRAGMAFTAEAYGPDRTLLREWGRGDPKTDRP